MPPAEPTPTDSDARIRDLVAECIDRFEDEGPAAIDAICAAHPSLAAAIRAHVDQLERIGLLRRGGGDDRFPERLGEFRLLRRLGGGGMGVVYLAEQPSLARLIALKVVRPAELHFSRARERFRREAQLIATLRHPGIVPVFAFGEEGDVPYYAMEYVDGADLGEVLGRLEGRDPAQLTGEDFETALREAVDERARAAAEAGAADGEDPPAVSFGGAARQPWVPFCLALARQAALALAHAHGGGVIHRDLKPSNLMLTRDGRVLLVDFGLSTGRKATRVTRSGSELGSLPYMAPEVLREGMEAVDARSDVYALGVTLYEMLALRSPFAGRDNETTRRNVLAGAPRRPSECNAAVPWDAETVCLAAMDLDPARRYATAADLARDLDNVLAMRPIEARPASAWLKTRRWAQRSPARAVATALALLVLIGGPLGYAAVVQRAARNLKLVNEELGRKQVALTAALGRESSERARAERHADRARRAVVELLQDVAADDLRGVPQMVAVRKRLLEKALGFYQEMLADEPDDPAVKLERARTGRDVADLLKELGRFDEAEAIYVDQIAAFRELAQEKPDDFERQDALASCLGQLGAIQSASGRAELAVKSWTEAIEILERSGGGATGGRPASVNLVPLLGNLAYAAYARGDAAESMRLHLKAATLSREVLRHAPGDPHFVSGFVNALDGAASCASYLARPLEALAYQKEAWDAIQEAVARAPGDRRLRADLILVANNYGLLLMSREDPDATERVLRRGYDEAIAMQRDFPDDPDLRRRLATIAINLAVTLVNRDAQDDAVPILDRAVATLDRLVAEVPDRVEYPYLLGSALAASAGLRVQLDEVDAAEAAAERAVKLLRAALARSPGHVGMTAGLTSALFEHGNVRRARGDLPGALRSAKEALALGSARIDVLYEGVEVLGDCARDADSKGGEPTADVFVDLALSALRDAIRGGFTDVERLKSAPELELLRERSAFDELLRAIPARAPGR